MSYIRASENKKYSKSSEPVYAFLSGPHNDLDDYNRPKYFIESYGDLSHPEHFVEIVCRIMERANNTLTIEEVNRLRKELELEELDKIPTDENV